MSPSTASGAPCASTKAARLSAFTSALSERGASGCATSRGAAKTTAGLAAADGAPAGSWKLKPGPTDGAASLALDISAAKTAAEADKANAAAIAAFRRKLISTQNRAVLGQGTSDQTPSNYRRR